MVLRINGMRFECSGSVYAEGRKGWVNAVRHTAEKSAVLCVTAVSSVRSAACDSEGRAVPVLGRHRTGRLWIQSMQGTGPEY